MRQHTDEYMVMPARIFPHFVVVHPEFRFRFLEALFNGPPHPTEPDQQPQGDTQGSVTEIVPIPRLRAEGALDESPHGRGGLPLFAQHEPFAGELVHAGACGAF